MPISLSPSVDVVERDLTLTAVAVATSAAAVVGAFKWGRVLEPVLIESELKLKTLFGEPDDDTAIDWWSAANFLAYGNNLKVVRVVGDLAFNASTLADQVKETFDGDGATDAFALTNSFDVEPTIVTVVVDGVVQEEVTDYTLNFTTNTLTVTFEAGSIPATGTDNIQVYANYTRILNEDVFLNQTGLIASFIGKYPSTLVNGVKVIAIDAANWASLDAQYQALFAGAPVGDEIHVAIIDITGAVTGIAGQTLEVYDFLSTDTESKAVDGTSDYYAKVLNDRSSWVWATGNLDDVVDGEADLASGTDDNIVTDGQKITGWQEFTNAETIDVGLLISGDASEAVKEEMIDIAETRADAVAFFSPEMDDVVNNPNNEVTDTLAHRNALPSTSYAFMDDNWKYQYDPYNDVNRWIPMNGDVAGLAARTDNTNDPWWSFAGLNRGQIKNVIKLAYNPTKSQRDELYKAQVNSIVRFDGQGTVLWGDKTLLARPSAFQHINVRRLFIVLEKSIATASKFLLFEFNDEFTRAQFRNLVEPFLRDVKGRRGIARFAVKADEENNTAEVINENRFVGDIFIDPARSINNITLNFVAVPSGVEFREIESAV